MSDIITLKEEEIRSAVDMDYNREVLYYKDLSLFLEKFKQNFRSVDCVSCQSNNHNTLLEKDGFTFRKCNECETVFISPRPDPKALQWWYSRSEHVNHFTGIFEKTADKRMLIYKDRLEKMRSRMSGPIQSVLEIGCGPCVFLGLMKEIWREPKITGIDINPEAVRLAKEKGIHCLKFSAEEFAQKKDSEYYDLIIAFEMLEHVYDPFSLIKAVLKLLEKDGKIYMTLPNYLSYDFLQIGDVYRNLFGPTHLNYYNPFSIMKLLERGGYSGIEIFCDGVLDTAIVGNYHSEKKMKLEGFWKYIYDNKDKNSSFLIDYQKLLQKHTLSGNMTVVARRP